MHHDLDAYDEAVIKLLQPLARLEPVVRPSRRSRRHLSLGGVAAGVVALGIVGAGAAAVASWGPLSGITSAEHTPNAADALPPAVIAQLRADEPPAGAVDAIGTRLIAQSRRLGSLPAGNVVYAVPTSKGKLCIVVSASAESCGEPLNRAHPVTMTVDEPGPGRAPVVWGATADGVVSISFDAGSELITVPVTNNFYVWQGTPTEAQAPIGVATVTFNDGSTASAR
jgi:hypothetical protein